MQAKTFSLNKDFLSFILSAACLLAFQPMTPSGWSPNSNFAATSLTHEYDQAMHNSKDRTGELTILSNPNRADVLMNGVKIDKTPLTLKRVPRDQPLKITIQKEGYETKTIPVVFGADKKKKLEVVLKMN